MEPEGELIPDMKGIRERRLIDVLRALAFIAALLGAAGSVGSVLWTGRQQESRILLLLFCLWALSPFMALLLANVASRRWSVVSRATLHGVMLVFSLVTLAIYGNVSLGPPKGKSAFLFIVVPPASLLLLAIIVPLTALTFGRLFQRPLDRRLRKDFSVLAMLCVMGVGTLLGSLWLEHRTELELPKPTGSFAVGRAIYDWTDDAHEDALAPAPGTRREVLAWIWYPASGQLGAKSDYVPAQVRPPASRSGGSSLLSLLTRDWSKVHAHGIDNADVSSQQKSYPALIMRGGASAEVINYTTLAEDLASHGYIVVGIDAPYLTGRVVFPDSRVIERATANDPELLVGRPEQADRLNQLFAAWIADMRFVLDRLEQLNASDASGKFKGRIDMKRVGAFGHSFGGAQAAQLCHEDSRCKAGVDIDGAPFGSVIQEGIQKPFLFLLSDHGKSSDEESRKIEADIQKIYDSLPPGERLSIMIRGSFHFTFSDDGALLKSYVMRGLLRIFGKLQIDGRRQLAVTSYCLRTFFDSYLKEASISPPKLASPQFPEIQALE